MTIERARTLTGCTRYDVWANDTLLASFDSYFDAVAFLRFMDEV